MGHMNPGTRENMAEGLLYDLPVVRITTARTIIIYLVRRKIFQGRRQLPGQYFLYPRTIQEVGADPLYSYLLPLAVVQHAPFGLCRTTISYQYIHGLSFDLETAS